MFRILKFVAGGVLGGLVYSFVSFVLLSSYARQAPLILASFGVQGGIWGFSYGILCVTKFGKVFKWKLLSLGVVCGALSTIPFGWVSINNVFAASQDLANAQILWDALPDLLGYLAGSCVLGGFVDVFLRKR